MSAPTSLTSEQISGLIVIKPLPAPNLEKNAPDPPTAKTQTADDKIHSSASRKTVQHGEYSKLHHINILGAAGIDQSSEAAKPVINGQLASTRVRNAQEERELCRPLKILKREGRSGSCSPHEEGEEEEEEGGESACATPTAREQRILQEILICPPPPYKKRHCKRNLSDTMAAAPSSSSSSVNPQYPHLLAAAERPAHAASLKQLLVVNPPDLHTFPDCIRALFPPN